MIDRRPPNRLFTIDGVQTPLFELPDPSPNIAIGKPATQSSVSPSSRSQNLSEDAGGAISGIPTGGYSFHTGLNDPPWWMVDLEGQYRLSAIWVFNRLDMPERTRHLKIFISLDGVDWTLVLKRTSDQPFGGAYGEPLMVTVDEAPAARFVRLELSEKQYLHLDQVKVFGVPAEEHAP